MTVPGTSIAAAAALSLWLRRNLLASSSFSPGCAAASPICTGTWSWACILYWFAVVMRCRLGRLGGFGIGPHPWEFEWASEPPVPASAFMAWGDGQPMTSGDGCMGVSTTCMAASGCCAGLSALCSLTLRVACRHRRGHLGKPGRASSVACPSLFRVCWIVQRSACDCGWAQQYCGRPSR